ncbi:FACT complex subunit [Heracleum sosnowskyi]|uniref:FACT complex subunit n=1 Tax=Heracleum sosnowskyi TaxID=360622 RepID=A0AAD8H955_9APIA|nr:FACT complex subunit [Heracleum sosnowskyi]
MNLDHNSREINKRWLTSRKDKGYEPSDVKSDSESENDDSASASLVESKEDEGYESEEWSKEEEGKTWHELDKEATNAGKKRGAESDIDEERNNRKLKALGISRAPERRPSAGTSFSKRAGFM